MLDLNASRNVAVVNTPNGDTHDLYFRNPTSQELVGYQAESLVRKGKKIMNQVMLARLKYGARVLTGFKEGSLGVDGQMISADPKAPKPYVYRQDWKQLLLSGAPQLVAAVGQAAFEGVRLAGQAEDELDFSSEVDLDEPQSAGEAMATPGAQEDAAPLANA